MLRRRGFMLVVVSLTLGVFAAYFANSWLNNRLLPTAHAEIASQAVVAAALAIPYGTKVESRYLKIVNLPTEAVPKNSFKSIEEIEGKVAREPIEAGELLFKSKFAEHDGGSTLAALIDPSMRAVTVRVNDVVGVAGFLLPGNRVDVLSSIVDKRTQKAKTETVLYNLKVLAVDQTTATERNDPVIVRAVTLEMTSPQSLILFKAKEEGRIQLTLRNPLDTEVAEAKPKPKAALPKPVVRKRPVSRGTTIQVIRGMKVDKTKTRT
ncbi:MAG: Flp pilus assembly protein CpaB [Pseudomonadales bacterium]